MSFLKSMARLDLKGLFKKKVEILTIFICGMLKGH
jgi:hypothetical protein